MTTTNTIDRQQLEQFSGQQIVFEGLVVNTKCPSPTQRFICLRRINVAKQGESTSCHHLWLDVSHLSDIKIRIAEWIKGSAYIKHYIRRNGSESYGLCNASDLMPA